MDCSVIDRNLEQNQSSLFHCLSVSLSLSSARSNTHRPFCPISCPTVYSVIPISHPHCPPLHRQSHSNKFGMYLPVCRHPYEVYSVSVSMNSFLSFFLFFFLFFFCDPNCCSDNTRSSTYCSTRELPNDSHDSPNSLPSPPPPLHPAPAACRSFQARG